jgi:hypothetical protein
MAHRLASSKAKKTIHDAHFRTKTGTEFAKRSRVFPKDADCKIRLARIEQRNVIRAAGKGANAVEQG